MEKELGDLEEKMSDYEKYKDGKEEEPQASLALCLGIPGRSPSSSQCRSP